MSTSTADTRRQHSSSRGDRAATLLLSIPLVATILIAVIRGTRHFGWDWPTHAHHHLAAHISGAVGLAVVGLLVMLEARSEPWAWWALAVAGVAIFGGYWIASAAVGLGIEAAVPNTAQGILTLTYAAGLVVARRRPDVSEARGSDQRRHRAPNERVDVHPGGPVVHR